MMSTRKQELTDLAFHALSAGGRKILSEQAQTHATQASLNPHPNSLREVYTGLQGFKIMESAEPGVLKMRGEFARPDVPTANRRKYSLAIWEREIARIKPLLQARKVIGELDHPDDGKLRLQNASHLITDLYIEFVGGVPVVIGEVEILTNTIQGGQLAALVRHGVRVGVSSRGQGSVVADGRGNDIVQEDFRLVTFDFVADPADIHAFPVLVSEAFEGDPERIRVFQEELARHDQTNTPLLFEGFDYVEYSKRAGAYMKNSGLQPVNESVSLAIHEGVEKALTKAMSGLQDDIRNMVSEAVHKIPLVKDLGSRVSNDTQNEVPPRDLNESALHARLARLEEENKALLKTQRELLYTQVLESQLKGHPFAEDIRAHVGDLSRYESVEALRGVIHEGESILQRAYDEKMQEESDIRRRTERMQESLQELEAENAQLREALEKSIGVARKFGMQLYASKLVEAQTLETRTRILGIVEAANVTEKGSVDEIVKRSLVEHRSSGGLSETHDRVRKLLGSSGISQLGTLTESRGGQQKNFNGLGADLSDIVERMPVAGKL